MRGPFEKVPNALILDAQLSLSARGAYAALLALAYQAGRRSEQDAVLLPPKTEIASSVEGCSASAFSKYLDELRERGWIESRRGAQDGRQGLLYTLHESPRQTVDFDASSRGRGPLALLQTEEKQASLSAYCPSLVMIGGRNLAFDAVAEECGVNPSSPRASMVSVALNGGGGSKKNPAVEAGIREQYWGECCERAGLDAMRTIVAEDVPRFEQALAEAVRARCAAYRYVMGGAMLTPTALARYWTDLPELARQKREGSGADLASRVLAQADQLREEGR